MKYRNAARRFGAHISSFTKSHAGRAVAVGGSLFASGAALASGSASAGAAIAGELSGGKSDMGLVIAACAILIGLLIVWAYTKRVR